MATAYDTPARQKNAPVEDGAPIVAVNELRKSFADHRVLNGISLRVNRGETLAVLGRSGTGKSVLLRLIIGLERPDSGSVSIYGQDIAALALDQMGEVRKKMGFLFQHAALYDSLTVAENVAFPLEHHRRDMSRSERSDRVRQMLAEVGMESDSGKMPSDLSGGMQKRADLACALIHNPQIIVLDEPFNGIDVSLQGFIWAFIKELSKEGRIIIISSHMLEDLEKNCTQFGLIEGGAYYDTIQIAKYLKNSKEKDLEAFLTKVFSRNITSIGEK